MKAMKQIIYIVIGFLALAIGLIGVILPILPTTPFLLLASFCFLRGSEKVNKWFKESKIYKKHLEEFVENKTMTVKQKAAILAFSSIMILIPAILVDNLFMRLTIMLVVIIKYYYFLFRIKTVKVTRTDSMNS